MTERYLCLLRAKCQEPQVRGAHCLLTLLTAAYTGCCAAYSNLLSAGDSFFVWELLCSFSAFYSDGFIREGPSEALSVQQGRLMQGTGSLGCLCSEQPLKLKEIELCLISPIAEYHGLASLEVLFNLRIV